MEAIAIIILLTLMGLTGVVEARPWRVQYRNTICKVIFWIYWSILAIATFCVPIMYVLILCK